MKLLKLCVIVLLFLSGFYSSKAQSLSSYAQISLLTCNPGSELYSVFGHSAIRVYDSEKGIDWVYNYGTFSFEQPGFYVKFVRGFLNYQLAVCTMQVFVAEYQDENRSVYEQVLDLNQKEKDEVFEFLQFNSQPENKYYMYDFFFDNCATRIRDVFKNELKEGIKFNPESYNAMTFREMMKPYLKPNPWGRFGINLVLGSIADRNATLEESMYLPDYMKIAFGNTLSVNGQSQKNLIKSTVTIFEQKPSDNRILFFTRPGFIFSLALLLVLIATYHEFKNKKFYKIIDFLVFLFIGIIGFILFFLWFGTNHTAVVKNWNLMWAIPTHIIFAFLVLRKSKSVVLRYYFLITGICSFLVLPLWAFIPQHFELTFIPLILMASIRSMQMFRYY